MPCGLLFCRCPHLFNSTNPHRLASGLFFASTTPEFPGHFRNRNMIENEKIDAIDSLIFGLNRTAEWRKKMAARYPSDPRNARASECLAKLATDATGLSDGAWLLLQPYSGWASENWRASISNAARTVGFQKKISDLPSFVGHLVDVLSQPSVAA
jgi:hypothetical protein